jgi:hypothetical protein
MGNKNSQSLVDYYYYEDEEEDYHNDPISSNMCYDCKHKVPGDAVCINCEHQPSRYDAEDDDYISEEYCRCCKKTEFTHINDIVCIDCRFAVIL